jgi:hypothetical protein
MRIGVTILFIVLSNLFLCRAQTDTIQNKDSSVLVLPSYHFCSSMADKSSASVFSMSFDWRKMSSPGYFIQDPLTVRRMLLNRYILPSSKTLFIYNDHSYYFDDPLQPFGRNDIPSVLILGALDYFFQWLEEK